MPSNPPTRDDLMDATETQADPAVPPTVTELLYGGSHPLSRLTRQTSFRDVLGFPRKDPRTIFGRIVTAHVRAFEAEQAGRWERATFYWEELWRLLSTADSGHPCWSIGREIVGPPLGEGPNATFRSRFIRDVLIASHAAFFRSQVEAGVD